MSEFLWGVYPYLCLGLFLLVPLVRIAYRPFGLTTRASGLFDRGRLGVASLLLHWGLFILLLAHLAGFIGGLAGLRRWIDFFFWAGLLGGSAALLGSVLALWRRYAVPEVRALSRWDDYAVHWFLIAILGLGLYQVIVDRIFGVAFTASAWLATVARLAPQPELMASATLVSKLHVLLALTFFGLFPFTKLVHFWTLPVNYLVRPYQSVRTDRLVHRRRWELRLRTDSSYMLYSVTGIVLFFTISSALLLGRPGSAASAAAGLDGNGRLMGEALYVSQCARCHGLTGRGDGPGAGSPTFAQPPRDLTAGRYRFVSTTNGVASDADLERVIRRGLIAGGMPAFDRLDDAQIRSLVEVLNGLWVGRPQPGAAIEVPARPAAASIARGRELYASHCASCHGASGRGDGPAGRVLPVPPADLAAGQLKAGRSPEDLYWRITAGILPSGMPPVGAGLSVAERWSLIEYLQSEILPRQRPGR
jgi:nitrate reductase gamma subunit